MLLGLEREGVDVDAGIGVAGVVLERLDNVEVGTLTLREAVLAVELQLGSDHWVLTPAVHVESSLSEHEGAGIGEGRTGGGGSVRVNGRREDLRDPVAAPRVEPESAVAADKSAICTHTLRNRGSSCVPVVHSMRTTCWICGPSVCK